MFPPPPQPSPVVVAAAVLVDDLTRPTRVLAARRTEPPALAGGWEFPGGKVEPGETPQQAVCRELAEELGVTVQLGAQVPGPARGCWPLREPSVMSLWWARISSGQPAPLEDHDELRWLSAAQIHSVPWLEFDLPAVAAVARALHPG